MFLNRTIRLVVVKANLYFDGACGFAIFLFTYVYFTLFLIFFSCCLDIFAYVERF